MRMTLLILLICSFRDTSVQLILVISEGEYVFSPPRPPFSESQRDPVNNVEQTRNKSNIAVTTCTAGCHAREG